MSFHTESYKHQRFLFYLEMYQISPRGTYATQNPADNFFHLCLVQQFFPPFICFFLCELCMYRQRPKPELTKINYLLWVAQYFGKYYTIDYPWPCISVSATWLVPPQPWQHRAAAFHTTSLLSSQCCWLWNWWHKLQPQISDSSLNHILVQCFLVCVLKQFSAVVPFFVCVCPKFPFTELPVIHHCFLAQQGKWNGQGLKGNWL